MSDQCLSWSVEEIHHNSLCMTLLIPTFLCHILFWIQVASYKPLRHCSLLWIYNYLLLDMLSLLQIFFEYLTRRVVHCQIDSISFHIFCILEAYANNYTTMVQSFALSLTNIYRYRLIVKNKGISIHSLVSLIFIHLLIYLMPLIIFIVQYITSSTSLVIIPGSSCDIEFSPFYNQFINLLILAVIPTCINVPVIIMTIRHVRSSQNTVRSVRHIHRRLIIQFSILYSIWFIFFLPQVVFMSSMATTSFQRLTTKFLDIAATLSDVLVITLFDRRFLSAWNKTLQRILVFIRQDNIRINPVEIQNRQVTIGRD